MMPEVPRMPDVSYAPDRAASDEIDARELGRLLWRRRWVVAAVVVTAVSLAMLYSLFAAPVYEASVRMRIDDEQSNVPVLDILKTMSQGSQVETEMEVLRSRTLAEDVVDSLGLQLVVVAPRRVPRARLMRDVAVERSALDATLIFRRAGDRFAVIDEESGDTIAQALPHVPVHAGGTSFTLTRGAFGYVELRVAVRPFSERVKRLEKAIHVARPNREADVIAVSYRGGDSLLVAAVPNLLARRFIFRRQEARKTEVRSTVRFLRTQIDTLAGQLAAAEDALRDFRQGAQVVSLDAEATQQVEKLADLQAHRNELESERAALAKLLDDVRLQAAHNPQPGEQSPYRRLIAFPTLLRNQAIGTLLGSLAGVEDQRAALLVRRLPADPDVKVLTQRVHDIEEQLRGIVVTYLDGLSSQVQSLDATLARFGRQLEAIPAKEVRYARLQRQEKVLEEIYTLLQTRLHESEIALAAEDASVSVVDPAIAPDRPIAPRRKIYVAVAGLVGLMFGIALACLLEYMDTSVKTAEDVEEAAGLPVLASIPRIDARRGARAARGGRREAAVQLAASLDPLSVVAEAYRALRTNVAFARPERRPRVILLTSPLPAEGKSSTSANLASVYAQQHLRVLLVEADMRRGELNEAFAVPRDPGLSNVLIGESTLAAAVRTVPVGEGTAIDFLPSGTLPPNPAELLESSRMRALLEEAAREYDLVLVDAPPVNLVTDAAVLGSRVDAAILVARARSTDRASLAHALEQLRRVRADVLGVVLNDVVAGDDQSYYGHYGAYAAGRDGEGGGASSWRLPRLRENGRRADRTGV